MTLMDFDLPGKSRNSRNWAPAPGALVDVLTPRRLRTKFDAPELSSSLARIGSLEARLARTSAEVRLAQIGRAHV